MSIESRNPLRAAGAVTNSGNQDTGQVLSTLGGGVVFTSVFSGLGIDTVVQSGGGRLDTILLTNYFQSGRGVIFYDSAIATSGGPFAGSGHKVVGILPPAVNAGIGWVSGTQTGALVWTGEPYRPQMPFFSGLVAAPWPAGTGASGTHGFSVSYTLQAYTSGGVQPAAQGSPP